MSWNARKELPQRLYRFKPRPQSRTSQTHTPVSDHPSPIAAVWERQPRVLAGIPLAPAPCPVPASSAASCPYRDRRSGAAALRHRPGRASFHPTRRSWARARNRSASSCSCRRAMHSRHLLGPGHCSRRCTCRTALRSGVRCCTPVADSTPEAGQRCAASTGPRQPGGLRTRPSREKDAGGQTGWGQEVGRCSCTGCSQYRMYSDHEYTRPHAHGPPRHRGLVGSHAHCLGSSNHWQACCPGRQGDLISKDDLRVGPSRS